MRDGALGRMPIRRFLGYAVWMIDGLHDFPPDAFHKADITDDALFYAPPRLVTPIDERATEALTAFYREILPSGGVFLDLMSSRVSHLPEEMETAGVIGHGMNARELDANPRLTRRFVKDLNQSSVLPIKDASLDAALCCVGVQYLLRPVEVFREVARTLRPRSPFIVSSRTAASRRRPLLSGGLSMATGTRASFASTWNAPASMTSRSTC
jgi:SAM-dependent methyltransferase